MQVNLSGVFPLILLSGAVSETIAGGGLIEKHAGTGRPRLVFTQCRPTTHPRRQGVFDPRRSHIGSRPCVYIILRNNTITTIIRSSLVLTQKRMSFDGIVCCRISPANDRINGGAQKENEPRTLIGI